MRKTKKERKNITLCPEVARALNGVMMIAEQKKRLEESTKVI